MRRFIPLLVLAAATLSACATTVAPRVRGGPPIALAQVDADQLRVETIHVEGTSRVLDRYQSYRGKDPTFEERQDPTHPHRDPFIESDFAGTVEWELSDELKLCATGERPVTAVVLIDEFHMDERLRSLVDSKGYDTISGVVEFVDPVTDTVIARYRIRAGTNSGNLLTRVLGDRMMNAAEEFGRALCMEAFGRNPRPPRILNSTRG